MGISTISLVLSCLTRKTKGFDNRLSSHESFKLECRRQRTTRVARLRRLYFSLSFQFFIKSLHAGYKGAPLLTSGNSAFHSSEQRVAILQNHSLQKTVDFSDTNSVDRKSVKRALFYIVLAIERYANFNVSVKAGFVNYFSNFLLISEN